MRTEHSDQCEPERIRDNRCASRRLSAGTDLTHGSLSRHLIRLTLPLIAGNMLQQLYNTIDAFVVARYAGLAEFAAIGVAAAVMNLFLFAIAGACIGVTVPGGLEICFKEGIPWKTVPRIPLGIRSRRGRSLGHGGHRASAFPALYPA